jgi:SAM-dependent methyltransferase
MVSWETRKAFYNEAYFQEKSGYVLADGGANADPNILRGAAKSLRDLTGCRSVLDCGCAVGGLLYGFHLLDAQIRIAGLELSQYPIDHAVPDIKDKLQCHDISGGVPFEANSFDLVTALHVLEHLQDYDNLITAVDGITRVARDHIFIQSPMYDYVGEEAEHYPWLESLNPLPHKARLALIGLIPESGVVRPAYDKAIEHPLAHPRAFWIALFESRGWSEHPMPESFYYFPNDLMATSFNTLWFMNDEN